MRSGSLQPRPRLEDDSTGEELDKWRLVLPLWARWDMMVPGQETNAELDFCSLIKWKKAALELLCFMWELSDKTVFLFILQDKCCQYWPTEDSVTYGDYTVELKGDTLVDTFSLRDLVLTFVPVSEWTSHDHTAVKESKNSNWKHQGWFNSTSW